MRKKEQSYQSEVKESYKIMKLFIKIISKTTSIIQYLYSMYLILYYNILDRFLLIVSK